MKSTVPLVSICSTTYNLEKYIAQAIESWLAQETDFLVEIIIADDCSTDSTRSIIDKYQQSYPDKIKLLTSDKNLRMLPNFIRSLKAAQGKYIAVCDGDDYWVDPKKLQKQVDFMEKNPDFSSIYTNSYLRDESTGALTIAKLNLWDTAESEGLLDHDDFMPDNIPLSPGHISGYLFRNHLLDSYPDWFYTCDNVTDFPLFMMLSKFGKAKFINDVTSVYRLHAKSTSTVEFDYVRFHVGRIDMYRHVNAYLDNKYKQKINPLIAKHYLKLAKITYKKFQYIEFLKYMANTVYYLI